MAFSSRFVDDSLCPAPLAVKPAKQLLLLLSVGFPSEASR